jgi:hypothetical protein
MRMFEQAFQEQQIFILGNNLQPPCKLNQIFEAKLRNYSNLNLVVAAVDWL